MELSELFELEPDGPDTFVGIGPQYPSGGLFGEQIVAQALRAAARTVDAGQEVHSLRVYFVRRVVARQAAGAILNPEASFHLPEDTADVQTVPMDRSMPRPDELASDAWSVAFDRRSVPRDQLLHRCWLAYMSDDMPSGSGKTDRHVFA